MRMCSKISRSVCVSSKYSFKFQNILCNKPASLRYSNLNLVRHASASSHVLESPFGLVDVPNQTLTDYVFRDIGPWSNLPMIVSLNF